jgi:diaminohydroxyphosphoribosylaminopyrimidine deaminase/5-amino-6-(5-phosphoribosylamino)uracil reductase
VDDERFMRAALAEAELGAGYVSPNPLVGAVAVKQGELIARAHHAAYGEAHAELLLLAQLNPEQARGATIYVNLEPCCHWGKTAPCTDALIQANVHRVVVGCADPNPLVQGRGLQALRSAGIEVDVGILEDEAQRLNQPFFTFVTQRRPWILLKVAQSLDGRIALASGESRWISDEPARREVHKLRARLDAVLVGSQTVLDDDPELTVRHVPGRDPIRIILDSRLRVAPTARIFRQARPDRTWLITTEQQPSSARRVFENIGATVLTAPANREGRLDLARTVTLLADFGITSILVEGGGTVHASLLTRQLFDRFIVCISPKIIGGDGRPAVGELNLTSLPDAPALTLVSQQEFGQDLWLEFENNVHRNH